MKDMREAVQRCQAAFRENLGRGNACRISDHDIGKFANNCCLDVLAETGLSDEGSVVAICAGEAYSVLKEMRDRECERQSR